MTPSGRRSSYSIERTGVAPSPLTTSTRLRRCSTDTIWAEDVTGLCEADTRNLTTGQEIELWVLLHRVLAAQQQGDVYAITVEPTATGYQVIRLPGPQVTQSEQGTPLPKETLPPVTVRFVDTAGREIDHLPKTPPWVAIPTTREAITVTGTVVDNAASAQVVTLQDADGTTWSIPWLDGTIVRYADGSPAKFWDITPGVPLEVTGFRSIEATTPNTLAAIRVILLDLTGEFAALCPPALSPTTKWECQKNSLSTRTCIPASSSEAGWVCYEDLKYGFALAYPTNWRASISIDEGFSNGITIIRRHSFAGPQGALDVDIWPMSTPDFRAWLEEFCAREPCPAVEPNAEVAGYPAMIFTDDPAAISPMLTVLVGNGAYGYRLWFTLQCDEEQVTIMRQIIDSFRFSAEIVPAKIPDTLWEEVRRAYGPPRCASDN